MQNAVLTNSYHFIGIAGCGMSALAQFLLSKGHEVTGSDRRFDTNPHDPYLGIFTNLGIKIYKQDGSGITPDKTVIITKAIEENNPDLNTAKKKSCKIFLRQELLKHIFSQHTGIAVAGTCGKSTVVGMISTIMDAAGEDFTIINGAIIKNYKNYSLGNLKYGKSNYICIETDESDGTLAGYTPEISVITNIGKDHFPPQDTERIFKELIDETKNTIILNEKLKYLSTGHSTLTFGLGEGDIIPDYYQLYPLSTEFVLQGTHFKLPMPGLHNLLNALAGICVGITWGVDLKTISDALQEFTGIENRYELIGRIHDIVIISDYSHNPDEIQSALHTAHLSDGRIIAVYQPHGFTPTKKHFKEIVETFTEALKEDDHLYLLPIYYAGGTVTKDISSEDLASSIQTKGKCHVEYVTCRNKLLQQLFHQVKKRDTVLFMGARDPTLHELARKFYFKLQTSSSIN